MGIESRRLRLYDVWLNRSRFPGQVGGVIRPPCG